MRLQIARDRESLRSGSRSRPSQEEANYWGYLRGYTGGHGSFFLLKAVPSSATISGNHTLLSFSLRTRIYGEARYRLFTQLRWVLLMQTLTKYTHIDLIIERLRLRRGGTGGACLADPSTVNLKCATLLLADRR